MSSKRQRQVLLYGTLIGAVLLPLHPSLADEQTARLQRQTERLQRQIDALQQELQALQRRVAETNGAPRSPPAVYGGGHETKNAASPRPSPADYAGGPPGYTKAPPSAPWLKGVNITFGGFIEAAALYRDRNEVSDMASDFNTNIPLPNSPLYHEKEFRGSARQSRLSLLASGDIDPMQHLAAYFETDFLGAGVTANSRQTNSYNPRLRQAYATYDNDNWHFHMLAGQSWSLVTQFKVGITPREENTSRSTRKQSWASTIRATGSSGWSETGTRSPGLVCRSNPHR